MHFFDKEVDPLIFFHSSFIIDLQMGRGQVVRQPVLTLLFGGSNPSAPVVPQKLSDFQFHHAKLSNPNRLKVWYASDV